jgi:molybdopterin-containing oxidoreductase family iron-sulfur binding subunit
VFNQASILGLYDPDRSKSVLRNGEKARKSDFVKFAATHFEDTQKNIVFLSESNSSLTLNAAKDAALAKFPNAKWVTYEVFGDGNVLQGTAMALGKRMRTLRDFKAADTILAIGDDFLNAADNRNSVRDSRDFATRRKLTNSNGSLNRLYVVENSFTTTGTTADHRLRVKAGDYMAFISALAAELGVLSGVSNRFSGSAWLKAVVKDLKGSAANSMVTAGYSLPAEAHALIAAINDSLGNVGTTVSYLSLSHFGDEDQYSALQSVIQEMNDGFVDTLVMLGTNPVFTTPSDWDFAGALSKVDTVIHLSDYVDETSRNATWHVNRAHYLEAWGDGFSYDGVASIIQPQIQPLHDGMSEIEFVHAIVQGKDLKGYDLVKATWSDFSSSWNKILHDGISDWSVNASTPSAKVITPSSTANAAEGIEVVIKADSKIFDGRYANNGWLQELPDSMTKITWDNVALMSAETAKKLGVRGAYSYEDIKLKGLGKDETDLLTIKVDGKELTLAAWILPGHADDSITIHAGYGRLELGRVANALPEDADSVGFNAYKLLPAKSDYVLSGAQASVTGTTYPIASTQDHASMEGRELVREATLAEYKENPNYASFEDSFGFAVPGVKEAKKLGEDAPVSLFNEQVFPDYEPQ